MFKTYTHKVINNPTPVKATCIKECHLNLTLIFQYVYYAVRTANWMAGTLHLLLGVFRVTIYNIFKQLLS
jgi:hypothetical protein